MNSRIRKMIKKRRRCRATGSMVSYFHFTSSSLTFAFEITKSSRIVCKCISGSMRTATQSKPLSSVDTLTNSPASSF
jgi:hypothetical protein